MINAGKEQAPGIVARLLEIERLHLTVTVGRDEALRARIDEVATRAGRPIEIHGWTPQMPELLMTHHVLIGKAGGATVQDLPARSSSFLPMAPPNGALGSRTSPALAGPMLPCRSPASLSRPLLQHLPLPQ
jgi:UDP-N-acetylglucosamine:LPS N-acetylglucosamine transferase